MSRMMQREKGSDLFACNQCILYAIVHSPLVFLADIPVALKALDLPSEACSKVLTLEILNVCNATLSL